VPVHTIARHLGGVVVVTRDGLPVTVPVPPDRVTARIAETTAADVRGDRRDRLSAVYDQLGRSSAASGSHVETVAFAPARRCSPPRRSPGLAPRLP
jgi:hypothetical protein